MSKLELLTPHATLMFMYKYEVCEDNFYTSKREIQGNVEEEGSMFKEEKGIYFRESC